jgi:hypothetical protein
MRSSVNAAIGGSTNFVIHLKAIAGRIGVELDARRLDPPRPTLPASSTCMPSGQLPDGGLLLCRRPAGGAQGDRLLPHKGIAHRQRTQRVGQRARRAENYNPR